MISSLWSDAFVQILQSQAMVAGVFTNAAAFKIEGGPGGANGSLILWERRVNGANPGFWGVTAKTIGNPGTLTVTSSNAMDVGTADYYVVNQWATRG